jgi:hypothetical protein
LFDFGADERKVPESQLHLDYIGTVLPSTAEEEQLFQHASTINGILLNKCTAQNFLLNNYFQDELKLSR